MNRASEICGIVRHHHVEILSMSDALEAAAKQVLKERGRGLAGALAHARALQTQLTNHADSEEPLMRPLLDAEPDDPSIAIKRVLQDQRQRRWLASALQSLLASRRSPADAARHLTAIARVVREAVVQEERHLAEVGLAEPIGVPLPLE